MKADDGVFAGLSRRRFLSVTGATGSVVVLGATTQASAATTSLSARGTAVIIRVARTGAVFPIPFPAFGEAGSAISRATSARLRTAVRRVRADRLTTVRAGCAELIALGHPEHRTQDQLLADIGRLAGSAQERQKITALVALAVATVSRRFDPNDDAAADLWIGGLRWMAEHGVQPKVRG